VAVRLRPGALPAITGTPASGFTDRGLPPKTCSDRDCFRPALDAAWLYWLRGDGLREAGIAALVKLAPEAR